MKRVVLLCVFALATLTACQKEVKQFIGDYSYKISGSIVVTTNETEYVKMLTPKIGQMNIVRIDNADKQRVMITMNDSGGRAYVCYGTIAGNKLTLDNYSFSTELVLNTEETGVYNVVASGRGELTGDMLVVNEEWKGTAVDMAGVTVRGSDILIIAKRN